MSTENIYKAVIKAISKQHVEDELNYLDIGAGSGELIQRLKETNRKIKSMACDYTDSLMVLPNQQVDIVDLNKNGLPYSAAAFDIVTATEVIEHLENPRAFLRDISRILKPGGICVLSTPNVLNLNSRLRYLWFGFANLFGPLSLSCRRIEYCSGHISPFSYFYLYHGLKEAGFDNIDLDIDKIQRSGLLKLLLFYLPIKLKELLIKRKEVRKYKTIDDSNREIVDQLNSYKVLLGRTIIVTSRKRI